MKISLKTQCIFAALLLLLAIPSGWPYGFYQFLRLAVFVIAIIVAWEFYKSRLTPWAWIFGAVAFLFNPLIPIYLDKSSWVPIDFVTSAFFFLAAYSVKRRSI